jgi:hypothetical protein
MITLTIPAVALVFLVAFIVGAIIGGVIILRKAEGK